ncbi:hypothetical protein EK21DRAFT_94398 [Setomelanomma holmii]|uniref:RING-type domain-containing protein n=1 Tax=Setomelanomma holmii TaxID=210430 RepID=A0A9P4LH02_9PLEO|nr:hypothetical protein EK21DRAFT_94398 [Setomelanomma holmii]
MCSRHRNVGQFLTGARTALEQFCEDANLIPTGSLCSICVETVVDKAEQSSKKPVLTKCGQLFHVTCLVSWVNESGASAANTCPTCRAIMCEAQSRVPASMLSQLDSTAELDEPSQAIWDDERFGNSL